MTQDEIIEMAIQAEIAEEIAAFNLPIIEAFANLVAVKAAVQEQKLIAYWKELAQGLQRDYDLLLAEFQAQHPWVGIDWSEIPDEQFGNYHFNDGVEWAEQHLKERNT